MSAPCALTKVVKMNCRLADVRTKDKDSSVLRLDAGAGAYGDISIIMPTELVQGFAQNLGASAELSVTVSLPVNLPAG